MDLLIHEKESRMWVSYDKGIEMEKSEYVTLYDSNIYKKDL